MRTSKLKRGRYLTSSCRRYADPVSFEVDNDLIRNVLQRQLCDLELICNGGFSPLEGFMNESDYKKWVHIQG